MSSVKLNKKDLLDQLQAKLTLKIGKKISQQEILDKCIEFAFNRLEEFLFEKMENPQISDKLIKKIKENLIDAPLQHLEKSDDELLYGM